MRTVHQRTEKGATGRASFDEKTDELIVTIANDKEAEATVRRYFVTEKEFDMPKSEILDHYASEMHKPTENEDLFIFASMTLTADTGVEVTKWEI